MFKDFIKNVRGRQNILLATFLLIIIIPSVFSLFHPGFFETDDGEWMTIRFSAFHQAFRDGQLPVRFLSRLNNGYGYPVSNFLYPGFMYLGEPIHLLGFGFINTIKIILGLSLISSAIFSYLWLSRFFNKTSALVGSLFYLYTPYHLFDLYKRGSVGEILALGIIPFIFWQIEKKSFFWTTVGIALLILSHNTLAFLFFPIIFLYMFISSFSNFKVQIKKNIFIFLLALGLSSFFWVPAIFELSYTRFAGTQVSNFSKYFASIELIGFSTIIILAIASYSIYKILLKEEWSKQNKNRVFILMSLLSLFSIFFASKISMFFWENFSSSIIQFPFRVLSYLPLSISFLSAFIIFEFISKKQIIFSLIFILILGFSSFQYLTPRNFFDKGEGFYSTNEGTTTVLDEYLPKWVKNKPIEHFKDKVYLKEGAGSIENLNFNSNRIKFNTNLLSDSKVRINTIYYPGWKASIDKKESDIQYQNEQGILEISLLKGYHEVEIFFSEVPLRFFADVLSILSFLILLILVKFYKFAK